jgi:hypothetical protein
VKPPWVHKLIVKLYTEERLSLKKIQTRLKDKGVTISHNGIWHSLKRQGIDTRTEVVSKERMECRACGRDVVVERNKLRSHKIHFCDEICRRAHLEVFGNAARKPTMKTPKSTNQRLAVAALRYVYRDMPKHFVAHFVDDNFNNHASYNLIAFINQHEHIRHHRGDKTAKKIALRW